MLGRSARRAFCLFLMFVGGQLVSGMVDVTPVIGAPQIDYPAFNYQWPFWPQLAIQWVLLGLGGSLVAAQAMAAWDDAPPEVPDLPRLAAMWAAWFAATGGLRLAGFLAWGTMGPLGVQQPIFRFALINGAISASLILVAHLVVARVARRRRGTRALTAPATMALGVGLGGMVVVAAIAAPTGIPPMRALADYLPLIAILAVATSVLIALTPSNAARG